MVQPLRVDTKRRDFVKLGFLRKTALSAALLVLLCVQSAAAKAVIPCGNAIGVTLDLSGCLVVGTGAVSSEGKSCFPAGRAGVKAGDVIKALNGCEVSSVGDISRIVGESGGAELSVSAVRDGKEETFEIFPVLDDGGEYKIGVWVKDALSGIGTLTYIDPETSNFGALGHGITDTDSDSFADIDDGNIYKSTVVSVVRGERGKPGELKGVFTESGGAVGTVRENGLLGIYGSVAEIPEKEVMETAAIDEVAKGEAYILSNVEGDSVEKFKIEITDKNSSSRDSKAMTIKVTDPALIQKTGGIVQGMSGSPIIQNGKLVGAVTHVFVNDPTKGYGIFAETMLGGMN